MSVTVPNVSVVYPNDYSTSAPYDLVSERFDTTKDYAEEAQAAAISALATLKSLFTTAAMPGTDISYDFQSIVLSSDIESKRPDAPTDSQLTPGAITVPSKPTLVSITVPNIAVPTQDIPEPGSDANFSYSEIPYQSDLYDALKTALQALITTGGTGLGATIEAAIWERARARKDSENERMYDEILAFFSTRGHILPSGALAGRLQEAITEQTRANAQINYEIMIEQARLAQTNTQSAQTLSLQFEGMSRDQANKIADRAYAYAKDAVDIVLKVYTAKVQGYVSKLEAAKLNADIEKIRADVQVSSNSNAIAEYTAAIDKYKADVTYELSIIENVAKVYGFKVQGYEADAKVAAAQLDAQIAEYKARIEQANNQTTLSLKEAELTLQSYLGALQLQSEAAKATGNVAAQLAASALSAVNASASIGYSVSRGRSDSVSHQTQVQNSLSLEERHNINTSSA